MSASSTSSQVVRGMVRGKTPGKLTVKLTAVDVLDKETREAMWDIFNRYYTDIDRNRFVKDLDDKDNVFLLYDAALNTLQGFSTIKVFKDTLDGKPYLAIYSGDTIINEEYWGQSALQRGFFNFIVKTKLQHPHISVYWFLISKGYKTYLLLSRNFPNYWPNHGEETPGFESKILDQLSSNMFGSDWKPEKGILSFDKPMGKLKSGVAPINTSMLERSDIAFFLDKNKGHGKGDELCCLGKVDLDLAISFPNKLTVKAINSLSRKIEFPWQVQS